MNDITIEVLEDGQVKIITGGVDGDIHRRIDNFIESVKTALGGDVQISGNHPDEMTHAIKAKGASKARY